MNPILKRTLTGMTVATAVVSAVLFAPVGWFRPVVGALTLLALWEFVSLLSRKCRWTSAGFWVFLLVGAIVLVGGLGALPLIAERHGNAMLLYVLAIVKFSDTGGFAFGLSSAKLLKGGNHKLCPTISPGKSWEGLLGSVVFSCAVSCAFVPLTKFGVPKALAFGLVAALVGTAGDLVESKFKRWVGVKDSSTLKITNGMGGILDMVDSLLFAPAVLLPFI